MTRKVINISFALFTFFKFILLEYVQNMSRNFHIWLKYTESIFCTYSVYTKYTEKIQNQYSVYILHIQKYTKLIFYTISV